MSYRLIDSNAIAIKYPEVNEMPCVFANLPDGIHGQFIDAQPEQQWIPCSERLPKHGGRYLISALDGIYRRTTVAPYLPRCKAWMMKGRMAYWKVIAWMPLLEPYKGDDK